MIRIAALSLLSVLVPLAAQDPLVEARGMEVAIAELAKQPVSPETYEQIRQRVRRAADLLVQVPGAGDSRDVMDLRWALGRHAFAAGDFDCCVGLFREVVDHASRNFPGHDFHREAQRMLAAAYGSLGRHDEARRIQAELVAAWAAQPDRGRETALARLDLGITLSWMAQGSAASRELAQALAEVRKDEARFTDQQIWDVWLNFANSQTGKDRVQALQQCQAFFAARGAGAKQFALAAANETSQALSGIGRNVEAIALARRVLAELTTSVPTDPVEVARAQMNLATLLDGAAIHAEAAALGRTALDALRAHRPDNSEEVLSCRSNLASALSGMGRRPEAIRIAREAAATVQRTLAPGHPNRLLHLGNLSWYLSQDEQHDEAIALARATVAEAEAHLPVAHGSRLQAMSRLAEALSGAGEPRQAVQICERILELAPGRHGERRDLAALLAELGHWDEALAMYEAEKARIERVRDAEERTYHHTYQWTLLRIAELHRRFGHFARALLLQEQVLQTRRRIMPEDSYYIAAALRQQASTRFRCGDFAGAGAQYREAAAIMERCLAPDAPDLFDARISVGGCLHLQGDLAGAIALTRKAREDLRASGRQDYSGYRLATANLGWMLVDHGELGEAEALLEEAIAAYTKRKGHSQVLHEARMNLGRVRLRQGRPAEGLDLLRQALGWLEANEAGWISACFARRELLRALADAGDAETVRDELQHLVRHVRQRLTELAALAPRELAEAASYLLRDVDLALAIRARVPDVFDATELFLLLESLRAAAGPPALRMLHRGDSATAELRAKALEARRRVAALLSGDGDGSPANPKVLEDAVRERDQRQKALLAALGPEAGFRFIAVTDVVAKLSRESAVVGFYNYRNLDGQGRYLAGLLGKDGKVTLLEIGTAEEVDRLVEQWRHAVEAPVRGRPAQAQPETKAHGAALRQKVLDPLLATGKVKRLYLCLDDALHLVPWDVLPEGDRLVGEQRSLVVLSSLRQLTEPQPQVKGRESLLALGGIDYDAEGAKPLDVAGADAPLLQRHGGPGIFSPLPHSRDEVTQLGASFEAKFGTRHEILLGATATKQALFAKAPGVRFLHIATHGYFSEGLVAEANAPNVFQQLVRDLAPMTLCGLALAGANQPRDSLGRVPGIVTAEELAGLDLSSCQLAVLSSCQSHVGLRRSGQGLASLQAALHAAGARTAITSLWPVSDEAARHLMGKFYAYLWSKGEQPARALWLARMDLRKGGTPFRDWAAWVLTGVPD